MKYEVAKKLQEDITNLCKCEGKLFFFGSGAICVKLLEYFTKNELPFPVGICDNSKEKQGTYIKGILVGSFEEVYTKYPDAKILITSKLYGHDIEKQILKKLSKEKVLNIQKYFDMVNNETSLFSESPPEFQANVKRYTGMLRGENNDTFSIKRPEDMPIEAKIIVQQLESYRKSYQSGENLLVEKNHILLKKDKSNIDFFEISDYEDIQDIHLTEYLNRNDYCGIHRLGEYGSQLIYTECCSAPKNVDRVVENISKFANFLQKQQISFLYMQLPNKISHLNETFSNGLQNSSNLSANQIVSSLEEKGVPTLDYRKVMIEKKIVFQDSFYRTDNHWTTRTAFYAVKRLCEELATRFSFSFDWEKLNLNNYNISYYPDIMLGAWGKKCGILYAGLDDFELILPKSEDEYTFSVPTKKFKKRGGAKEIFLFPHHLDWAYHYMNPYGTYSLVEGCYTQIINLGSKKKKLLFLRDSFAMPMASFLAPQFSELHFFDIRQKLNKKDVLDKIEEVKPDIVVMAHWPTAIATNLPVSDINPYT